jgi:hypothetical protein
MLIEYQQHSLSIPSVYLSGVDKGERGYSILRTEGKFSYRRLLDVLVDCQCNVDESHGFRPPNIALFRTRY